MADAASTAREYSAVTFGGRSDTCYGLEVVCHHLAGLGWKRIPFNPRGAETILVSLFWPEQLYDLVRWRKRYGITDRKIIAGGNCVTANPAAVLPFVSACYLGDGELWDGSNDSPYLVSRERPGPARPAVAPHITPVAYEDHQVTKRTFCEISRGCRRKCLFCQYTWLKPYREVDPADIREILLRRRTRMVRIFAADRFQHTVYPRVRRWIEELGGQDSGSDVSVDYALRHPEYLRVTHKARSGIEGMSYRLRRMVGKPYTDDQLCHYVELLVAHGIRCIDWYVIYGLPTESDADADAFIDLLARFERIFAPVPNPVLAIHWNAFEPNPVTPFQWEGAAYGYPRARMQRIFEARFSYRVLHEPKMTSDRRMAARMLAVRSGPDQARLLYNVALHPGVWLKDPDRLCARFEREAGYPLCGAVTPGTPMPWDRHVVYPAGRFVAIRNAAIEGAIRRAGAPEQRTSGTVSLPVLCACG